MYKVVNQEEIYHLLQVEDWSSLIDIFYRRKELIKNDPLLSQSLETTLHVITEKAASLENSQAFIDNLENIILMSQSNFITLKDKQKEVISVAIVNGRRSNLSYAYNYAKNYPNNEICKEVIEEYEQKHRRPIVVAPVEPVKVTENEKIQESDFRKTIFNSLQEVEFFLALKRVFDTYQVYPNVGLSIILDFEKIKDQLTHREKDFFFRTSVDFVVFEPFKNYYPIYFFEIDSVWHDADEQKEKDQMKDKIFSISGQKLYRIRKFERSVGEKEFEKLIRKIRKETR